MELCEHHIPYARSCPWCAREGDAKLDLAAAKKPWQLYQHGFNELLTSIADKSHGPLAYAYVVLDMNGHIYMSMDGYPDDIQVILRTAYGMNEKKKEKANVTTPSN